jgi:hypothetical protein
MWGLSVNRRTACLGLVMAALLGVGTAACVDLSQPRVLAGVDASSGAAAPDATAPLDAGVREAAALPVDAATAPEVGRDLGMESAAADAPAVDTRTAVDVAVDRPGPDTSVADPALVGSWTFDVADVSGTTVRDRSGGGNDGQLVGGTLTMGKVGQGVGLNGTNAYVDIDDHPSLRISGSMTVSAWVSSASAAPAFDQVIVSRGGLAPDYGFELKTSRDSGRETFAIAIGTPAGHVHRYGNVPWTANTWYHVTGVYDAAAGKLDLYVNGYLDNGALMGAVPASQRVASAGTAIGKRSVGGNYFGGLIDEVRMYSRALSAAEVSALARP